MWSHPSPDPACFTCPEFLMNIGRAPEEPLPELRILLGWWGQQLMSAHAHTDAPKCSSPLAHHHQWPGSRPRVDTVPEGSLLPQHCPQSRMGLERKVSGRAAPAGASWCLGTLHFGHCQVRLYPGLWCEHPLPEIPCPGRISALPCNLDSVRNSTTK